LFTRLNFIYFWFLVGYTDPLPVAVEKE